MLKQLGINITAYTSQVGPICLQRDYHELDFSQIEQNAVRCPDMEKAAEMAQLISEVKADGDTIGGIITCVVRLPRWTWIAGFRQTACRTGRGHARNQRGQGI